MTVMRVTVGIYHKPYNLKGTVCDGTINLQWARSSEIFGDNGFGGAGSLKSSKEDAEIRARS